MSSGTDTSRGIVPSSATVLGGLRTTGSALRLLRERGWWLALLGVIALSVIFVFLGRWQYHRHEARSARNALVSANYDAAPAALSTVLPDVLTRPGAAVPAAVEWRPVRVTGSYLSQATVLLRNRPLKSQNGYEVLVPLRTQEGPVLIVNRGWIPSGSRSAAEPDAVPPAPTGTVQVVARLRPSEPTTTRLAPTGQANRANAAALSEALEPGTARQVVGGYAVLIAETPAPATTPLPLPRPDPGLGINFAYAIQWVAFAVAAYVLFAVALVREVRRRAGAATIIAG